jgi:hypothetical protein
MQRVVRLVFFATALLIGGCATKGYQQVYSGDAQIYCNSPNDAYCEREGSGYQDEAAHYRVEIQPPGRVNADIPNFAAGPPQ